MFIAAGWLCPKREVLQELLWARTTRHQFSIQHEVWRWSATATHSSGDTLSQKSFCCAFVGTVAINFPTVTSLRWWENVDCSFITQHFSAGFNVMHQRSTVTVSTSCNKRIRPNLKLAGASYRIDEIYIKVGKTCKYLYRAVDKDGQTIEFMRE